MPILANNYSSNHKDLEDLVTKLRECNKEGTIIKSKNSLTIPVKCQLHNLTTAEGPSLFTKGDLSHLVVYQVDGATAMALRQVENSLNLSKHTLLRTIPSFGQDFISVVAVYHQSQVGATTSNHITVHPYGKLEEGKVIIDLISTDSDSHCDIYNAAKDMTVNKTQVEDVVLDTFNDRIDIPFGKKVHARD